MIEAYLDELVARLRAELAGELVGAWLFGSAALGDFDRRAATWTSKPSPRAACP